MSDGVWVMLISLMLLAFAAFGNLFLPMNVDMQTACCGLAGFLFVIALRLIGSDRRRSS